MLLSAETSGRAQALRELLAGHDLHLEEVNSWSEFLRDGIGRSGITVSPLDRGLVAFEPSVEIIVESQLYGERVHQAQKRESPGPGCDHSLYCRIARR